MGSTNEVRGRDEAVKPPQKCQLPKKAAQAAVVVFSV